MIFWIYVFLNNKHLLRQKHLLFFDDIDGNIDSHEVQKVEGKIVTGFRVLDILCEVEHEPYWYKHDNLIEYLNPII